MSFVTEAHSELDAPRSYVTQFWGKGCIGFGRKAWPSGESEWPSGLWVWDLRLEVISAEESAPPSASLWISRKKANVDVQAARLAFFAAAKELLASEEMKDTISEASGDHLLWLPAPSKHELLGALSDGDGQRFVDLFKSQFDLMARFVPVLDEVFRKCLPKE